MHAGALIRCTPEHVSDARRITYRCTPEQFFDARRSTYWMHAVAVGGSGGSYGGRGGSGGGSIGGSRRDHYMTP